MVTNDTYDLIVIGGGGGGYPAAFRLAQAQKKVLLVDTLGNLGGNCLYEGCVPSKSVRLATLRIHEARQAPFFGVDIPSVTAAWSAIRNYKDGVQARRYLQHQQEIAEAAPALTFVHGTGRLLSAQSVEITDVEHSDIRTVFGKHILIATGSEPQSLPITGFEYTWNSHDLFAWQKTQEALPDDMLILGGGYIGVETASMLSDLGIRITLLEMAPTILSGMDPDLIRAITANLSKRVTLVTGVQVTAIQKQDKNQFIVQAHQEDGQLREWQTSRVLAAVGRIPHLPQTLGLDHVGVAYDKHGIVTDPYMRTNIPHIYAAGDVNGQSMLFHSAVRMSEMVAEHILNPHDLLIGFHPEEMPTTVFSRPEGMSVGLTAEQALSRGLKVDEYTKAMGKEAWAQIAGELEGFFKLVVSRSTGQIIGAHSVGTCSAALSAALHMAVHMGLTPRQLAQMTFPHPTQFEIIDRLARSI
ncbi:dihydrolipoyl dehydrogenase [Sulfobacillus thermosulfidooxidans]|uniref:dihydrolipoyl dehydrogenase n=1 Tax=Sulfobacillus thermosulfidooxidans TaxID=28034 RepID=UPI0006B408BA|nr:dihydrolipoyl dehydrogenase [Sulfobacillus thermosulfidooxidans]